MRSNEAQGCLIFAVLTVAGTWYFTSKLLTDNEGQRIEQPQAHTAPPSHERPRLVPPEVEGDVIGTWYWNCPNPNLRGWWVIRTLVEGTDGIVEAHERSINAMEGTDDTSVHRFRRQRDLDGRERFVQIRNERTVDQLLPFRIADDGVIEMIWVDGEIEQLMFQDPDVAEANGDLGFRGQATRPDMQQN